MKALRQLEYAKPLEICEVPIPSPEPGQAVVRILAANILSYMKDIYNGARKYPYPTPLTTGSSAIGRIHSFAADSTSLQKDTLVLIDITYRSRDDPTHVFLSALHQGHTPGSTKLMSTWRDGTYAEYASIPLENCYPLNESLLLSSQQDGGHGYSLADLLSFPRALVPYGGLTTINLRPSETIVIAPATGPFGIAAVQVALALGARVIAMGRNTSVLSSLKETLAEHYPPSRLITVPISGDVDTLTKAIQSASAPFPIDAYLDISPPIASDSPHIKAAILSLRHSARVSLMGGLQGDIAIPHSRVMHWNIEIKGKWMFERQDVRDLIRMVEVGNLKLGVGKGGEDGQGEEMRGFVLEEWEGAFEWAERHTGMGEGAFFRIGE